MRSLTLPATFCLLFLLAAVGAGAATAQKARPYTFRAVQAGDTIGSEVVTRGTPRPPRPWRCASRGTPPA
jgi:hypothetical protein